MNKGDVVMAKRFSKKYGNKGWPLNYLQSESYVKMPDATSLHHCLKNKQLKLIWFLW